MKQFFITVMSLFAFGVWYTGAPRAEGWVGWRVTAPAAFDSHLNADEEYGIGRTERRKKEQNVAAMTIENVGTSRIHFQVLKQELDAALYLHSSR